MSCSINSMFRRPSVPAEQRERNGRSASEAAVPFPVFKNNA
ncbi:hypothetical protein CLOHYLEM_04624 [[Clostridium] hylemonae DSM 15053]|uniref:Uncharacterized protein n=1 Tax=[Clostridium] hylemonae DSM 15053 TaxID=553973 RepID=C0BXT7_9FIRM|nr:hypothetical protein CLOHYLEM_04624 [[Clostridium] hylemonae DSM 15053]